MLPNNQGTQARGKGGALPSNEWKSREILKIRVDPSRKGMGGTGIAFFDILIDVEQIEFSLSERTTRIQRLFETGGRV